MVIADRGPKVERMAACPPLQVVATFHPQRRRTARPPPHEPRRGFETISRSRRPGVWCGSLVRLGLLRALPVSSARRTAEPSGAKESAQPAPLQGIDPYACIGARQPAQRVVVDCCEGEASGGAKGKLRKATGDVALESLPKPRVSVQSIQKSADFLFWHQLLLLAKRRHAPFLET
jgi:hypothetical protein